MEIGPPGANRGQRAGKDPGDDGDREREQHHARVDRDLVGARHLAGQQRRGGGKRGASEQEPDDPAGDRQRQRFDDELLEHAAAAGAERRTNRQLLAPAERSGEQQVADVGARDQQHEDDRAQQHAQRRSHLADDQLLQRNDGRTPAGVLLRILTLQLQRDVRHLRFRPREVDTGFHAGDHRIVVVVAHRPIGVLEGDRHPQIAVGDAPGRHRKGGRHHTDDGVRLAVERERAADGVGRAAEMALPESGAEHHDMAAPRRVLFREEHAAEKRLGANGLEEPVAHGAGDDGFRAAAAGQRERTESIQRHAIEEARVALPVVEIRGGHREARHPGKRRLRRHVKDAHQPIRLVERQRSQQHRVDDAEDGGVGADAERQDRDDGDRERRRAQ